MKHPVFLLGFLLFLGCATAQPPAVQQSTIPDLSGLMSLFAQPAPRSPTHCENGKCVFKLDGPVSKELADDFVGFLDSVKTSKVSVVIVSIDSRGGVIAEGYRMIHAMEAAQALGEDFGCQVDGSAMSMAFAILQSCTTRLMTERSTLMIHGEKMKPDDYLTQRDFENLLTTIKADNLAFAAQCSKRLTITKEAYLAHIADARDWVMASDEAMAVGAVDRVVRLR